MHRPITFTIDNSNPVQTDWNVIRAAGNPQPVLSMSNHTTTFKYSGQSDTREKGSFVGDFQHCVIKNTLNGNGFMGVKGDLEGLGCIVDRVTDRITNQIMDTSGMTKRQAGIMYATQIDPSMIK